MTAATIDPHLHQDAIEQQLITGKRRRKIQEAITGYLFVFPATLATLVFGLWPVIAGFYESLKSGSPITNKYVGLENYLRAMGSLTYIILFALCLVFIYSGYRAWRSARQHDLDTGRSVAWLFVLPGLLTGAGIISAAFVLVTGADGVSWFPVIMLLLATAGYVGANHLQLSATHRQADAPRTLALIMGILAAFGLAWILGPQLIDRLDLGTAGWLVLAAPRIGLAYVGLPILARIRSRAYIGSTITMGTTMLAAILLGLYTIDQLEGDVEQAQSIARTIFNQKVLEGTVFVTDDNGLISGLSLTEEVTVEVEIGGEVIEAPLAAEAYSQFPANRVSRLEAEFANKQKIMVVLADGSVAEGLLTGLPAGEKLTVSLTADNPAAVRQTRIFSALDVGEAVVRRGGHTEPLRKQIYATMLVFISLGTIYLVTWVRRRVDDDEQPRLHRALHWLRVVLGICVGFAAFYLIGGMQLNKQAAHGMAALSEEQFKWAYEYATGQRPNPILRTEVLQAQLLYWPQVLLVLVGASLIGAAYLVWQSLQQRESKAGFGATLLLAIGMMVGGWLMLSELPRTLTLGGRETEEALDSLWRTAIYSAGTVPVQLGLGLFLAYLLFSEIDWGKSLYRVIYFMPYIAPSVATSTVFLIIFSLNKQSLANQALGLVGLPAMTWLKEPNGIIRLAYQHILGGNPLNIPDSLAGPSLALTTVILYNIWVFAGYNAVVFLAGLGAIPTELYEAAQVDGAGRWSRFRSITLPLLSPTTFFLSMLSIIGTFKAFSHIYVLRSQATGKEIDTMSVHIFNVLYSANDPGYAAALAFALFGVILILTLVQNRLAREQVFYG